MRYICGTQKLREKFLEEERPSLEMFNKIASQHKAIDCSVKAITEEQTSNTTTVNRIQNREGQRRQQLTRQELIRRGHCSNCGFRDCEKHRCRAMNSTCNYSNCSQKGHFWRMCQKREQKEKQNKQVNKTRQVTEEEVHAQEEEDGNTDSEIEEQVKAIKIRAVKSKDKKTTDKEKNEESKEPWMKVKITAHNTSFACKAIADTGTSRTLIAQDIANRANLKIFETNSWLAEANGTPMACTGKCCIQIAFGDKQIRTTALVTLAIQNEILIGLMELKELEVIHQQFPQQPEKARKIQNRCSKEELLQEFEDVFFDTLKDSPMAGAPMRIHLKEGVKPNKVLTARQYPVRMARAAKQAMIKLKKTMLEEVHEPTDWIAPGFFILKGDLAKKKAMKEGLTVLTVKDLRLVVDYTGLNKAVMRPVHTFLLPGTSWTESRLGPSSFARWITFRATTR